MNNNSTTIENSQQSQELLKPCVIRLKPAIRLYSNGNFPTLTRSVFYEIAQLRSEASEKNYLDFPDNN